MTKLHGRAISSDTEKRLRRPYQEILSSLLPSCARPSDIRTLSPVAFFLSFSLTLTPILARLGSIAGKELGGGGAGRPSLIESVALRWRVARCAGTNAPQLTPSGRSKQLR